MKTRYHVKWKDSRGTHYGIYVDRSTFNKDIYKHIPMGYAVVDDAIRPVSHAVPETALKDIPFGTFGESEYDKYIQAEYDKAIALDATLPTRTVAVGALFHIGVADGSAPYVVTKVNKKTCDVEWRGYCADRWIDHYFGYGRKSVPIEDVKRYLSGRLFGGKKTKEWVPLSKIG
jgi:hypothetical protein